MSIVYKKGNLLDAPEKVIIHGCNSCGVMGSGVAKLIRDKWPNVYEVYKLKHDVFGLEMGKILPVATVDGKIVVNCITQENFGRSNQRYVDYAAIESCIVQLNERAIDWDVTEMAMPFIGAGLGGGDWRIIEEIILKNSKNFTSIVYSLDGLLPDGSPIPN